MKQLINNWPFKMLSVVLSLVLWLYVTGELERGLWWTAKEITFTNVPIKIMSSQKNDFNVEIKPDKAKVVLYSYKSDLSRINPEDITLFVNLNDINSGTYELYIDNIIPEDFNIREIEPSTVMVTIQENFSKSPLASEIIPIEK